MRKWIWLISLLPILFTPLVLAAEKAFLLNIDGPIVPAVQDYIKRGLDQAVNEHAALVILQINTPGGLESTTRKINDTIIASPVPIVAFVAPSGARAASAGTYIVYASHYAVMANGTNIGAASPVNLMGTEEVSVEDKKAMNDSAAYLRSLAELRGRNSSWANDAVYQSKSISAIEAKKQNVVNEIADNYPQLLQTINGKPVTVQGKTQHLNTTNIQIETIPHDWRYSFLTFITNPNIAYILMLIAIYGLFFELSSPGLILPGVTGIIALLLVLYAFELMPINYVGLTLVCIGIAFMIFEIFVSSFGIIGIGGVIAFIIGSVMLFDLDDPNYHLTWTLIFAMSFISIGFFFMVLMLVFRAHKQAIITGKEGLIGSEGLVLSVMNEQVVVSILGEIWDAQSPVMLNKGDRVKVTAVHGLKLMVEPIAKRHSVLGD